MSKTALLCSDRQLRVLLQRDEQDDDFRSAAAHVESCGTCRSRLTELAADLDEWADAKRSLTIDEAERQIEREEEERLSNAPGHCHTPRAWSDSMINHVLSPPSHPEMLGSIGRYDIERLVGTGGMGVVFKAFDSELNRPVAIKVLAPYLAGSGAARQRFAREARAVAAVVNEHVVAIHNVESDGTSPFLVMQYVAGESLQTRLDRSGPLEVSEVLRIALQTAKGLAAAHAQGLIHRDVKPSNVLLEKGVDRALLTDFGLARAGDDASLTRTGCHPGTPQYMSPEQARGESVDQRSDLFSLGSLMYTMCTGRPPFRAESSYGILRRITDTDPRPIREIRPEAPKWLSQIVGKLMAKRSADRFTSAEEIAELLEECLAHVQQPTVVPRPVRFTQRIKTQSDGSSTRKRLAGVALACLIVCAGIIITIQRDNAPDTIVEVREGSQVKIAADGTVEVKLPNSKSRETNSGHRPVPISPTFMLTHPSRDKQAPPFVTFSHDGKWLATASGKDHTIRVWDAATGEQYRTFRGADGDFVTNSQLYGTVFSPDGRYLATGGEYIIIWNLETGDQVQSLKRGNDSTASSLAFSPDGRVLATCPNDAMICLWDVKTGALRERIRRQREVNSVHYSADGRLLATSDESGIAVLRGVNTNQREGTVKNWVVLDRGSPFFPAAGAYVAFMDDKQAVLGLWDTRTGKLINCLTVASDHGKVCSVAISRDRKRCAVAYLTGKVTVWRIDEPLRSDAPGDVDRKEGPRPHSPNFELSQPKLGKQGRSFHTPPIIAFSPDGLLLASTDSQETIYLWDVKDRRVVRRFRGPEKKPNQGSSPVAFSPDGRTLACGGRRRIDIWNVVTGQRIRAFDELHSSFPSISFSPDGVTLASCDGDYNRIQFWDVASGKLRNALTAPAQECAVHFSRQGKLLVAWDHRHRVLRGFPKQDVLSVPENWDVARHGSPYQVESGTHVTFLDEQKTILGLWDSDSGNLINRFSLKSVHGGVRSVAVSPDRQRLAVAYRNGVMDVWLLDQLR